MEGNVSSVQSRPAEPRTRHTSARQPCNPASSQPNPTDTLTRDQEKWDAWDANKGLSRTEAKRRYIETLIRTMKTYASDTPDSQALVSELEFVWMQVKDAAAIGQSDPSHGDDSDRDAARDQQDENDDIHDAPISQFDDEDDNDEGDDNVDDRDAASALTPSRSTRSRAISGTNEPGTPRRWRKRIEAQLIRLNVQVAALSEQVESRSYLGSRRGYAGAGGGGSGGGGVVARIVALVARTSWFLAKIAMVDSMLVLVLLLYLRRRSRERLKDAVRVVLGDAQTVALGIAGRVQQVGSQLAHRT